jgi:hypothetical protein
MTAKNRGDVNVPVDPLKPPYLALHLALAHYRRLRGSSPVVHGTATRSVVSRRGATSVAAIGQTVRSGNTPLTVLAVRKLRSCSSVAIDGLCSGLLSRARPHWHKAPTSFYFHVASFYQRHFFLSDLRQNAPDQSTPSIGSLIPCCSRNSRTARRQGSKS